MDTNLFITLVCLYLGFKVFIVWPCRFIVFLIDAATDPYYGMRKSR